MSYNCIITDGKGIMHTEDYVFHLCGFIYINASNSIFVGDVQSIWKIEELRAKSVKQHTLETGFSCAKVISRFRIYEICPRGNQEFCLLVSIVKPYLQICPK